MENTLFFGNGINRLSENHVTWSDLLDSIKGISKFESGQLPNTMVYERIFLEKHAPDRSEKKDELEIKSVIASELRGQGPNGVLEALALLPIEHYLTTNYDYAFEKALDISPVKLSSEDIYSLRRKRMYESENDTKFLWNIHGEIDNPKSIMLGLDHYCGSVSKIDAYVKGMYSHKVNGADVTVKSMLDKLKDASFCYTSWVDLFFSSNVHILGFSLDYSETDIWWLLNKRARFSSEATINNKVYFYTHNISDEKKGLLEAFNVEVITIKVIGDNFEGMYWSAINKINVNLNQVTVV
ncbi:SIR2 family protein [Pectobacterium brasiliense]|uniref:SIR2 family protein n=1 Tax=Pectobacterium brasiliense TaxID=180957 RepID=UPI0032ECF1C9